jgi:hypothetical protein
VNISLGRGRGRSEGNGKPLTIESSPYSTEVPTLRAGALALPAFTTAARPSAADAGVGATVFDTDLKKVIASDGAGWFDATGVAV